MVSADPFENERKGANAGLNPMFGDWQHRFRFAPVPYADWGAKRAASRKAIQDELTNQFFYTAEVRLEITLHLDVQTVLETSETADLDNYAKSILDALKGPDGIILDDTQVQTLIISYLDNYDRDGPFFDTSISAGPDDFMLKPLSFYEMPDGLWYPEARRAWADGGADELSEDNLYFALLLTEAMSSVKRKTRHQLRQMGIERIVAYKRLLPITTGIRGFHKSRIDSGFQMFERAQWLSALEAWKLRYADKNKMQEIETLFSGIHENYERMATALMLFMGLTPPDLQKREQREPDLGKKPDNTGR